MAGCRALTDKEVLTVLNQLESVRDRLLFALGVKTGFRISELLAIQLSDVWQFDTVTDRVRVTAQDMKGGERSREVIIPKSVKPLILEYIKTLPNDYSGPLFLSQKGGALDRRSAWRIMKNAFKKAKLQGKLATHSCRKTYAAKMHDALGNDIFKTQKALGHKSLNSTASYLEVGQEEIDGAALKL